MDKIKKIIVVMIFGLILIGLSIVIFIYIKNAELEKISDLPEADVTEEDSYYKELIKDQQEKNLPVDNSMDFYTVELCVQKYINYIAEKNTEILNDILYNKNSNEITDLENQIEINTKFYARKMNVFKKDRLEIYSVYGNLQKESENGFGEELYIVVLVDKENGTYAIHQLTNQEITDINDIELSDYSIESIQKNENNEIESTWLQDNEIISKYMEFYKKMIKYNPVESYNLLDKEYAEKRFNGVENYIEYLKENRKNIYDIELTKYKISYNNGEKTYVVADENNSYYIIKESAIMEFTIMLDTYTIDTAEFIEKYDTATSANKAGMNIEKIINAVNAHDYDYIYSKLYSEFKENNFPTKEQFEEYIKNNWFEKTDITYNSCEESAGSYIYKVTLKDE